MSTTKFNPKLVGKVRVWHHTDDGNNDTFVGLHNENQLIRISTKARDELASQTAVPNVWVLEHMNKQALKDVLSRALKFGPSLRLIANGMSIIDVIQMLNVVETLGISPPQKQIEGHLVHLLSHSQITPAVMAAVHECFGQQGDGSRPWRVMVHQIAFDVANENLTIARRDELEAAATPYPDLDDAIYQKFLVLKGCKEHKERMQKRNQKLQVKQQKREYTDHHKRGARKPTSQLSGPGPKKTFETFHEKNEKVWFEEENGLRAVSENTVAYIKQQKPAAVLVTRKMNQRQRKLLPRPQIEHRNGKLSAEGSGDGKDSTVEGKNGDSIGAME